VIVGPTASGKSAAAEAVDELIHAELISADSMQVYAGMDVATDKPGAESRRRHRYHLLDVAAPGEPFTVVRYRELAREAIDRVVSAGRLPVLVGGSGLYVRAVVDDLEFPAPRGPLEGARARERLEALGGDELYARLKRVDPEAASRIHPHNKRRLLRVLEFIEETGQPFSALQERWARRRSIYDLRMYGLRRSREELHAAIDRRVDGMLEHGLVDEARKMRSLGLETAAQALGYKELEPYLAGREDLDEAVSRLKRATRRFAKRQLTWFERDERVRWIDAGGKGPLDVARIIVGQLREEGWLEERLVKKENGRCE